MKYTIDNIPISKYAETHKPEHPYDWYAKRCLRWSERTNKLNFTSSDVLEWENAVNEFYETFNGLSNQITYDRLDGIRRGIIKRCTCPNRKDFKCYGGRGITICDEWRGKGGGKSFINWAVLNGYNDAMTLDRIDGEKGYSPNNCRWIPMKENCEKAFEKLKEKRAAT